MAYETADLLSQDNEAEHVLCRVSCLSTIEVHFCWCAYYAGLELQLYCYGSLQTLFVVAVSYQVLLTVHIEFYDSLYINSTHCFSASTQTVDVEFLTLLTPFVVGAGVVE